MKQIMYIGKKPTKRDSVNNEPNRVWRGLGDVLQVTDAEAGKLLMPIYKDVWCEVTGWDEERRSALVTELREKFRAEQRAVTPAGEIARALSILSTEDMEAELRRRRGTDGKADENQAPAPQRTVHSDRSNERDPVDRPSKTEQVVEEIAGAIAQLDKESRTHFDGKGAPVLAAVVEKLGYKVSQAELDSAVKLIKGK